MSANLSIPAEFSMNLQLYDVLGLKPLGTLGDRELDLIAFVKRLESRCLNGRMVHEDIVSGSATYESVALVVVEPLYCSLLFHALFLPVSIFRSKAEGYWLSVIGRGSGKNPPFRHKTKRAALPFSGSQPVFRNELVTKT